MEIHETDDYLPDEEDIYGVNDIDEYDPDYWQPAAQRQLIRQIVLRLVAGIAAVAFIFAALYLFR